MEKFYLVLARAWQLFSDILVGSFEAFHLFMNEVYRFILALMDFLIFHKTFIYNNFRFIMMAIILQWKHQLFILINEELLVAACFLAAVHFLYSNLGDSVTEALNERSDGIRKELSTFLLLKQENLNELYKSEESFLTTSQNIALLQNYCQDHFAHLDSKVQLSVQGRVKSNLHAKLEALQATKKGLQPALHAQLNASFREAVLESFSQVAPLTTTRACLKQLKNLNKAS